MLASADILLLSWVILTYKDYMSTEQIVALAICFEVISKMVMYYVHEITWDRIKEIKEVRVAKAN